MDEAKRGILIGVLAALGCEVLFGLSYSFTKNAMRSADEIDLLGWRFLAALLAILLLRAMRVVRTDYRSKGVTPILFLLPLFSPVLYFVGETWGISHTTASESGVLLAAIPVVAIVASSLILKRRPTRRQVIGILTTLIGVIGAVAATGLELTFSPIGYGFLALAVIAYSLYAVYLESASRYTNVEITLVMLAEGFAVFGGLFLVKNAAAGTLGRALALPFESPAFAIAVLYQGIGCSMLAFFLANIAIGRLGVNRSASFVGVSTVVGILAGVVALVEPFTLLRGLATVLILTGVYIANSSFGFPRARRRVRSAEASDRA